MIDHYTTDEIYFFIMVTTTLTASTTATITLNNFRNANDPSPGIVTNMIYWSRQGTAIKQKVSLYTFPISPVWTDGGIYIWAPTAPVALFPEGTLATPNPNFVTRNMAANTDMDWDSETIYRIRFTNCHPINVGGLIRIVIPTGYATVDTVCSVFQGIVGFQQKLSSSLACVRNLN